MLCLQIGQCSKKKTRKGKAKSSENHPEFFAEAPKTTTL
jgi:hypothetical protein